MQSTKPSCKRRSRKGSIGSKPGLFQAWFLPGCIPGLELACPPKGGLLFGREAGYLSFTAQVTGVTFMLDWINNPQTLTDCQDSINREADYEALWWSEFSAKARENIEAARAAAADKLRDRVSASACTEKDTGRFPHLCRKCSYCLKQRQSQWVLRARHEYLSHERTWFVTLTYRGSVEASYKEVQKWLKRIRLKASSLRFMATEERGSKRSRKHWHVLLHCSGTVTKRMVKSQWKLGRCQLDLVKKASGAAAYAAKYLSPHDAPSRIRASVAYGNSLHAIRRCRSDLCQHYDDWLSNRAPRPEWVRVWGRISQHEITLRWATAPPF